MFRITILICCLFVFCPTSGVWAQSAQVDAKAAYLLAEESYGKGDMRSALEYINEASNKLGVVNAKLSYMKIMILKELSTTDTSALAKLDNALLEFEKAPDVADFNEEKTLEIAKIRVERRKNLAAVAEIDQRLMAFEKKLGWHLGLPIDSVILLRKDKFDAYFKKNPGKNGKVQDGEFIGIEAENGRSMEVLGTAQGILAYYQTSLYSFSDDTPNFDKGQQAQKPVLADLRGQLGYLPEPKLTTSETNGISVKVYTYTWTSAKYILHLQLTEATSKTIYLSSGSVTLSLKSL